MNFEPEKYFHLFIQRQIANLHISYVKAFNKKYNRRGSLFQTKPKSKEIKDINSILRVSRYIHINPIKHKLVINLTDWEFSSYCYYIDLKNDDLAEKKFILSYFDSIKNFKKFTDDYMLDREEYLEEG